MLFGDSMKPLRLFCLLSHILAGFFPIVVFSQDCWLFLKWLGNIRFPNDHRKFQIEILHILHLYVLFCFVSRDCKDLHDYLSDWFLTSLFVFVFDVLAMQRHCFPQRNFSMLFVFTSHTSVLRAGLVEVLILTFFF